LLLLLNEKNEGFAKANNRGIRIALECYNSQYVFLLNNDTVISPDSLQEIVTVMESESKIAAAQAVIYYYYNPDKIANAGGFLLPWGQTKYRKIITNRNWQTITFLNGCALIFKRRTLEKYGALTEDFFHGEEDFEYSMRLKKHKALKVCINNTKVYHKIGVTANELLNGKSGKKVLLFAVNRLWDMKRFYPYLIWISWRN
jgi:GT2 family glycosyltransferase